MNWVLGTANFGSRYGITNFTALTQSEVKEILEECRKWGINTVDTANAYLGSESILGEFSEKYPFNVSTKISVNEGDTELTIKAKIKDTREKLRTSKLDTVLLHSPAHIVASNGKMLSKALDECVDLGYIRSYGASVYSETDLEVCLYALPRGSTFQVPENPIDQRMRDSKVVKDAGQSGIKFQVRSIFLQGLLVSDLEQIPYLDSTLLSTINKFYTFCEKKLISPLDLCIAYAATIEWASDVIFGVNGIVQLREILNAISNVPNFKAEALLGIPRATSPQIDPRNWKRP